MGKPEIHAKIFSPSKSSLWLNCDASVFFKDERKESNEQAKIGTLCHELASIRLSESLGLDEDYEPTSSVIEATLTKDFEAVIDVYVKEAISLYEFERSQSRSKPIVFIEQKLESSLDSDLFGTCDFGMISDLNGGTLTIMDFKTGRVQVDAFDKESGTPNTQLTIYASMMYEMYRDFYPIKNIRIIISQPLIAHYDEVTMSALELDSFISNILKPAIERIRSGSTEARVTRHCRFCPGRVKCKALNNDINETISKAREIEILSESEIAGLLAKADGCISYFNDIKEYCLTRALNGERYDGFKLVRSRVVRKISDEEKVASILENEGINPYQDKKLLGITELTRKIGKPRFNELLAPYITYQEGSLVLVKSNDAREEVIIEKKETKN